MALYYHDRNLKNIEKLADHTKEAALKWHEYLVENDIDILIYETIRTEAQQKENVRKGASQTMKSYHLVGQALDFVPVDGARTDWNGYMKPDIQKAVKEAKRLGFEWGGDWKNFIDRPHLQFNHKGYGTDTFGKVIKSNSSVVSPSNESIVDYLKRKGIDSSFTNRSKLAVQYGILSYKGTAEQNVELFTKLKQAETGGHEVAESKSDYKGTKYEPLVEKAKKKGIMFGYDENMFGINDNIKRGDFLTVLERLGLLD